MQSSKKHVKMFQYFKNKIGHRGILFLQETHSSIDTEIQEQLKTQQNVSVKLENFDSFCSNNVITAGDFNLFQ